MQKSVRPTNNLDRHQLFRVAWHLSPMLALAIVFHLLAIPFAIGGWLIDPKVITGTQAWIKPLKFALSGAIYSATLQKSPHPANPVCCKSIPRMLC